jgi:DNA replication and repair protein RecF
LDRAALDAFSAELVKLGNRILQFRKELIPRISPLARLAYRRISQDAEDLKMDYQPSVREDFELELKNAFERERRYRTTVVGPHRDEFKLELDGKPAESHASEGQKRSLVVALKMAQAEYLAGIHGAPPVLLIDDVMGELDARRRSGFLPLLTRSRQMRGQVFMTCTEQNWPAELSRELRVWKIQGGQILRER